VPTIAVPCRNCSGWLNAHPSIAKGGGAAVLDLKLSPAHAGAGTGPAGFLARQLCGGPASDSWRLRYPRTLPEIRQARSAKARQARFLKAMRFTIAPVARACRESEKARFNTFCHPFRQNGYLRAAATVAGLR